MRSREWSIDTNDPVPINVRPAWEGEKYSTGVPFSIIAGPAKVEYEILSFLANFSYLMRLFPVRLMFCEKIGFALNLR